MSPAKNAAAQLDTPFPFPATAKYHGKVIQQDRPPFIDSSTSEEASGTDKGKAVLPPASSKGKAVLPPVSSKAGKSESGEVSRKIGSSVKAALFGKDGPSMNLQELVATGPKKRKQPARSVQKAESKAGSVDQSIKRATGEAVVSQGSLKRSKAQISSEAFTPTPANVFGAPSSSVPKGPPPLKHAASMPQSSTMPPPPSLSLEEDMFNMSGLLTPPYTLSSGFVVGESSKLDVEGDLALNLMHNMAVKSDLTQYHTMSQAGILRAQAYFLTKVRLNVLMFPF